MSGDNRVRNAGHDDWVDALEMNNGYYLSCENDHGFLPPRQVCPHCGSQDIQKASLPKVGTVVAKTTIHVPTSAFEMEAPYTTAIVDTGPVRVTGQLRGEGAADVAVDTEVTLTVGETGESERVVVFEVR